MNHYGAGYGSTGVKHVVVQAAKDLRNPSTSIRDSATEAHGHIGDARVIGPLTGGVRIDKRVVTPAWLDVLGREPKTPGERAPR